MRQALSGLLLGCALAWSAAPAEAQTNVTDVEYFYDSDPGFGAGTAVGVAAASNIVDHTFTAGTGALSGGMHTLYVRSRDAGGKWSLTAKLVFAKVQGMTDAHEASNVKGAEYFFDTDPGFGNGAPISIPTPGADITGLTFTANVAPLSGGMHTLYVRTRDSLAGWSVTSKIVFAKVQGMTDPHVVSTINGAEYFFDSDPGFGAGTAIPITTPSTDINGLVFNADVASLSGGMHTLYIRTRDASGSWSHTGKYYFAKVQGMTDAHNPSLITKAEYFFNSDPGFGNGTAVPIAAAQDVNGLVIPMNVMSLPTGLHTMYVRTRDSAGSWSVTAKHSFTRIASPLPNPHTRSKVVKAEYFFDSDPGFGGGVDVPITSPDTNLSNFAFNVNVAPLSGGMHTLYVRTRDSVGQWSQTTRLVFAKVQGMTDPHIVHNITNAEYFYDTDPGFGAGTDIPMVAGTDLSGIVFGADVASLSNGVHTLYVRSRDAVGSWSLVGKQVFAKVQPLFANPHVKGNLVRLEYFIDTDPGFGAGSPVTITPDTNISNYVFNADLTGISNGAHKLYVRSKNNWSITNVIPFNGGGTVLAATDLRFDAMAQADRTAKLDWSASAERNASHYTVERSTDAANWSRVETVEAKNGTGAQAYNLIDREPGTGVIYYRLTAADRSGKLTYAPIRFVRIGEGVGGSEVWPNPSTGEQINVRSTLLQSGQPTITVIGSDGRLHARQSVEANAAGTARLEGYKLAAGTYFVNIRNGESGQSLKLTVTE